MTKCISLTKDRFATVDDSDFEPLSQYRWKCMVRPQTCYAYRYEKTDQGWHKVFMHQAVMNPEDGMEVDHINGNGLDNQRRNLRVCTHAENCWNQRKTGGTSSHYKGVAWNIGCRKWEAKIRVDGILRHLGVFASEEQAASRYNAAARKHFGEFARLNEIGESKQAFEILEREAEPA